ncbi:MAG: PAS domain-containing protein [Alphaproteobacteria bacterium]|nr:PAS domain-containing protein [Alphaproteobacteria bacterium]MDE2336999.1 PAS domain-containing protein [Alphaproteobacteria bacterium]
MGKAVDLTGVERFFDKNEIIVSKTDLKGHITYANRTFLDIADYTEEEALGAPHSLIRHPGMPRCVFQLLWDTIQAKKEIFAYVVNRAKHGDHYWVLAHVTPSFDAEGQIDGYHSNRRVPDRSIVEGKIIPLYKTLLAEEERHANRKDGMKSATGILVNLLQKKGIGYDEFIFSL